MNTFRTIKVLVAFMAMAPVAAMASHGTATVSDIDGDGLGPFMGSYTHESGPSADHPWYTFNATAGDNVTIDLTTTFGAGTDSQGSYLWLYEVVDGMAEAGDSPGAEIMLVANSTNNDTDDFLDQMINFMITSTNQYIVQVDSWLGGSGDYTLTITGATVASEPSILLLLGAGLFGFAASQRRRARLAA